MDLEYVLMIVIFSILFSVPCCQVACMFWLPIWKSIKIALGCMKKEEPPPKPKKKRNPLDHVEHDKANRKHDKDARLEAAMKHAWEAQSGKKKKKKKPKTYLGSRVTPLPLIREYPLDDFLAQPLKHGRYIGPRAGAFDGAANAAIRTQQERARFEVENTFIDPASAPRGKKAPVTSSGWGV